LKIKTGKKFGEIHFEVTAKVSQAVIPPARAYLSEISDNNRNYDQLVKDQSAIASKLYQLTGAKEALKGKADEALLKILDEQIAFYNDQLTPVSRKLIQNWPNKLAEYQKDNYEYTVREKIISTHDYHQPEWYSCSQSGIAKIQRLGRYFKMASRRKCGWSLSIYGRCVSFKREGEDPTRMFAGEGGPERTNKRFHYVSMGQPAKRLSTAFDSVTLYGEDPDHRPDIYGKVGNSGVSIATVDDAKKLYSGFDLCDPKTSVSMTINGPAPMLLAFFMNAAIDQQCEKWLEENKKWNLAEDAFKKKFPDSKLPVYNNTLFPGQLPEGNNGLGLKLLGLSGDEVLPADVYAQCKQAALQQVRGTVQADILKEDQAQNTCIFSTEFALKLMGDVQQYFIEQKVRNFYSVSISGYHIAEAGANP
jgi:methylmalonyl-CoA mutase